MGSFASRIVSVPDISIVYRGRKRKYIEEDDSDSESKYIDKTLQTPKKRKLLSTAQYIYKTLFQEEQGSDVTVYILGKAWKLHRVYISQSPYFASMFSGSWKEANEEQIHVEIADPNITLKSLSTVLGSFYQDEVNFEPKDVIPILATATLLQLQGLIDQCTEVMTETTNVKTVVSYYDAAVSYGVSAVKNVAKRWLEVNLLSHTYYNSSLLKCISAELMTEIISSPGLVAMQTEFCIYMMLRVWLYVQLNEDADVTKLEDYYRNHDWREPLLKTARGKPYVMPFKALRLKYLVAHDKDVQILNKDMIIPPDWLNPAFREQWLHLLRIDANKDCGPKHMSEEDFARECFRCGRCVDHPAEHIWRWTAFQYGLDLVVCLDSHILKIRRNHRVDYERIEANHGKHNIIIKANLISLNEQKQIKHIQESGMLRLSLHKNEEKKVMVLDKQLTYPLYISFNMQVVTPFTISDEDNLTTVTALSGT